MNPLQRRLWQQRWQATTSNLFVAPSTINSPEAGLGCFARILIYAHDKPFARFVGTYIQAERQISKAKSTPKSAASKKKEKNSDDTDIINGNCNGKAEIPVINTYGWYIKFSKEWYFKPDNTATSNAIHRSNNRRALSQIRKRQDSHVPTNGNNATLVIPSHRNTNPGVRATRNITPGTEIMLAYGPGYWAS